MEGGVCLPTEVEPERGPRPRFTRQPVLHHLQHDQRQLKGRRPASLGQVKRLAKMVNTLWPSLLIGSQMLATAAKCVLRL